MTDTELLERRRAADRALDLAKAALCECDEHGFHFPAIDLSLAIDKLEKIRSSL
jgi:hypothetical protein